jgi:chromosome partitioning protein
MQGASVLSEFGTVAPSTIGNRIAYANAMQAGSSAADEDKLASEEIELVWNFISSRLFDTEIGNAKEKVRFDL